MPFQRGPVPFRPAMRIDCQPQRHQIKRRPDPEDDPAGGAEDFPEGQFRLTSQQPGGQQISRNQQCDPRRFKHTLRGNALQSLIRGTVQPIEKPYPARYGKTARRKTETDAGGEPLFPVFGRGGKFRQHDPRQHDQYDPPGRPEKKCRRDHRSERRQFRDPIQPSVRLRVIRIPAENGGNSQNETA